MQRTSDRVRWDQALHLDRDSSSERKRASMNRLLQHIRSNAVAYVALFVALGGTSYAALKLPANSVGNRQIKNHSITPNKLDPSKIGAVVRYWAVLDSAPVNSEQVIALGRGRESQSGIQHRAPGTSAGISPSRAIVLSRPLAALASCERLIEPLRSSRAFVQFAAFTRRGSRRLASSYITVICPQK